MRTYESNKSATTAQTRECRALIFRHSMMTSTMESATVESATVESATVESATVESATVEFATVESFTVEPIMKSAKAFAEKSAIIMWAIAVAVRGIAVASVIPPSVETSCQVKGRNQKHAKHKQFCFHYPMRRQAGRMTSGAEDIPCCGRPPGLHSGRQPASLLET